MDGAPRRPIPVPNEMTKGFWEAASRHELAIQRCGDCRRWFHPPVPLCTNCHSEQLDFEGVEGGGTVYTYTRMTEPLVPGFDPPLVVIGVELDEQPALVVVSNLLDRDPADVRIGERVELTFEETVDGFVLPQFRPAGGTRP